ncbi:hypothetical protein [Jannaschia sp. LMIT008]|uniref:hypothetical protein n=1 Tax=Jannaschia maritima TaxID=3032585 RepID=UPI002812348B|nr:hypothetical protein [Jannaschia sp. LMIT008]
MTLTDFETRVLDAVLQASRSPHGRRIDRLSVTGRDETGVGFLVDLHDPGRADGSGAQRLGGDVIGLIDGQDAVLRFNLHVTNGRLTDIEMWNDTGDWPDDVNRVRFVHDGHSTGPGTRTAAE